MNWLAPEWYGRKVFWKSKLVQHFWHSPLIINNDVGHWFRMSCQPKEEIKAILQLPWRCWNAIAQIQRASCSIDPGILSLCLTTTVLSDLSRKRSMGRLPSLTVSDDYRWTARTSGWPVWVPELARVRKPIQQSHPRRKKKEGLHFDSVIGPAVVDKLIDWKGRTKKRVTLTFPTTFFGIAKAGLKERCDMVDNLALFPNRSNMSVIYRRCGLFVAKITDDP